MVAVIRRIVQFWRFAHKVLARAADGTTMTLRTPAAALAALALLALPAPASAATSPKSAVREFTGTVASVAGKGKSFRLRRTGRAAVVVKVSRKTRVAKGAKPRRGRKLVVRARRSGRAWLARSVKLVPVPVAQEDDPEEDIVGDEPDLADEEFGDDDSDPVLDLEDTLGDVFGDDGSADEPE